jgi:hypothetical protein
MIRLLKRGVFGIQIPSISFIHPFVVLSPFEPLLFRIGTFNQSKLLDRNYSFAFGPRLIFAPSRCYSVLKAPLGAERVSSPPPIKAGIGKEGFHSDQLLELAGFFYTN